MRISLRTRPAILLGTLAVLALLLLRFAPQADASKTQLAMFEDDSHILAAPAQMLKTLQTLGVDTVRMSLAWSTIAPDSTSATAPAGFDATNPASYSPATWAPYDTVVQDARADGISIDFVLTGPAPRWATGAGQPSGGPYGQWKPNATMYGQFVRAIATRYSGSYRPAGASSTLPRVSFWELWDEPNWGQTLAPQATGKTSTSPALYRGLLNAGWSALQQTGHGHDTILVGSLSPRGDSAPGDFLTTEPLPFVRTLYCVSSKYRKLTGSAATSVACPATASQSKAFRSGNPALFSATGVGVHPYPYSTPPTKADSTNKNYVEFNEMGNLASALDRAEKAYGAHKKMGIYNTEYGYITNPPNASDHFVSPTTAATYLNWAEYLSYKQPRVLTTMQYLLIDPPPTSGEAFFGLGGFATGLEFANGTPKATYAAYRMPIFLPVTTAKSGRSLEVWGCVRPAHAAGHGASQSVQIQLSAGGSAGYKTVKTVRITNVRGYFDAHQKFTSNGSVRLAWSYPGGPTIYSRSVTIKVR